MQTTPQIQIQFYQKQEQERQREEQRRKKKQEEQQQKQQQKQQQQQSQSRPSNIKLTVPERVFPVPPVLTNVSSTTLKSSVPYQKPLGRLLKDVLDALLEAHRGLTPIEIRERTDIDIESNPELLERLRSHENILFDQELYHYKSKHLLRNKDDILNLIQQYPYGIDMSELKDSYKDCIRDVAQLVKAKQIVFISAAENKRMLYPLNEERLRPNRPSKNFLELWNSIRVPDVVDFERSLEESNCYHRETKFTFDEATFLPKGEQTI